MSDSVFGKYGFVLPKDIKGRDLNKMIIPTVCNLENMLNKLIESKGDFSKLKQWEKRSYKAYCIEEIEKEILSLSPDKWKETIRDHILKANIFNLGANCIDIYLVAYVSENYGIGRDIFIKYIIDKEISDKQNSAKAIWQVGKGDGVYLDILNSDGRVKDWGFMREWLKLSSSKLMNGKTTNTQ